ncbi:uncharacterized protein LOC113941987, partial [Corapipo altera]|uniref:uncharacterized protein LOC113941987 n=1 Tax=Corapipo altera TaxID=415028 RepID=UPI000FD6AEB3
QKMDTMHAVTPPCPSASQAKAPSLANKNRELRSHRAPRAVPAVPGGFRQTAPPSPLVPQPRPAAPAPQPVSAGAVRGGAVSVPGRAVCAQRPSGPRGTDGAELGPGNCPGGCRPEPPEDGASPEHGGNRSHRWGRVSLREGFLIAPVPKAAVPRSERLCLGKPGSAEQQERLHGRTSPARSRTQHSPGRGDTAGAVRLQPGSWFPLVLGSGGELCFLLGERTALGSCSMTHSCAKPGSLSSRMSSATVSLRSPFLLLGEHEVDGEDPQASAGPRDSYSCDFPTALVRGTFRVPWVMCQLSCWSFCLLCLNTNSRTKVRSVLEHVTLVQSSFLLFIFSSGKHSLGFLGTWY